MPARAAGAVGRAICAVERRLDAAAGVTGVNADARANRPIEWL